LHKREAASESSEVTDYKNVTCTFFIWSQFYVIGENLKGDNIYSFIFNPLKTEEEEEEEERGGGGSERHYGGGGARKYNSGLEGSQAVPARPSGMGNGFF
jgi:hypothetical protein